MNHDFPNLCCPLWFKGGLKLNHQKELLPDPVDSKTMSAGDNTKGKDSNGSFDVDTLLIPVEHTVSVNNLPSSVLVLYLKRYLASDPLIQSWAVIDATGGAG